MMEVDDVDDVPFKTWGLFAGFSNAMASCCRILHCRQKAKGFGAGIPSFEGPILSGCPFD